MMLKLILFYVFAFLPLLGIPITLEHAVTPREVTWGLMGRDYLAPNHGMTFTFPGNAKTGVWMFNCNIDLSVAFLDKNFTIVELHELQAYPNEMDPRRPVRTFNDLVKYPPNDPIVVFFRRKSIFSKQPVKYMVEMSKNWFPSHNVRIGDRILWDESSSEGEIVKL
ncbi:MAG: DUF192 domain-containing protein [Parachlamydiales bacterium]|jgi:hypothetical protein